MFLRKVLKISYTKFKNEFKEIYWAVKEFTKFPTSSFSNSIYIKQTILTYWLLLTKVLKISLHAEVWNVKEKYVKRISIHGVTIYNLYRTYIIHKIITVCMYILHPSKLRIFVRSFRDISLWRRDSNYQTDWGEKEEEKETGRLVVGTRSSRPSKLNPRWTNGLSFPVSF